MTSPPDMPLLELDAHNRQRALALTSFIVEAPAGAGKTELLTQRYLRLLATVAEPEEIFAITFTNKAAAEMRGRILASLVRAASGVLPAEAHKRITFDLARAALDHGATRGWRLIEQPARLRILTIDALCASLARQMPLLSRFGAQPRICDKPQQHYEAAAQRTLAMLDEDGPYGNAFGAALVEALRYFDNDGARLSRLLASMLARRDQWLRHCQATGHGAAAAAELGLAALVGRDLLNVAKSFDARLQMHIMPAVRFAAAQLAVKTPDSSLARLIDWTTPFKGDVQELDAWRALADFLLTQKGTPRKAFNVNNGLPPGKEAEPHKKMLVETLAGLDAASVAALVRIRCLPTPACDAATWRVVEIMATLLRLAAAQLWTLFNEVGEADFIEVAQRALLALGDEDAPSDLALSLDYRVRHLLVDEFQDTSPLQVELLEHLTAGWQAGDGRTLFCVGDPMQSIYRFRKADVGLFLGAAAGGIGSVVLEPLRLYRNNRSSAAVIDWINDAFACILPPRDEAVSGAIAYRPFSASRPDLDDDLSAGVYVHALTAVQDDSIDDDGQREAACILDIIARAREADPHRRIAVLVRARPHLAALVALIRRTRPDLAFQAVEVEPLAGRQVVQDLLALTRALLHRADRVHWLAVLRAPWCGLCLADLHALSADAPQASLWQLMNDEVRLSRLSADGQVRLAHVRAVIAEAYAHQGRSGLRRWIEGVWLKLGGAACLHAPGGASAQANVTDVQAYLDLLDRLDAAGEFDVDTLAAEVAELYAAPDGSDDRLQLMTIHKSKGLEFDTVILPGLHRKPRGEDHQLMLWEEVAIEGAEAQLTQLIVAPYVRRERRGVGVGADADATPTPYDYLRLLEQERSGNEAMRVLYVAATRAIRRLHLVGVAPLGKDGAPRAPANTFLELLWPVAGVAHEFVQAAEMDGQSDGEGDGEGGGDAAAIAPATSSRPVGAMSGAFVPRLVRLVAPCVPEILTQAPKHVRASIEAVHEHEDAAPEAISGTSADRLATDIGTLTHACLQQIASDGLTDWDAQRIAARAPALRLWLTRRGHAADVVQAAAARVAALLNTMLVSERGRWLLDTHEEAAAELALTDVVDGGAGFAKHVVDRCFVADGERWIVDYKTAEVGAGRPDAAALRAHAERYRPQLERYARLFADEGRPLRRAVFYVLHDELVEMS